MGWRRYLNALRDIDDVSVELVWRLTGKEYASPYPPSWTVPDAFRADLTISWPTAYNWGPTGRWVQHLLAGLRRLVRVELADIPQGGYPEGTVVTHFSFRGASHHVVIDFSDYMDRICEPALREATRYFKMQYRRGGYGDPRIVPGGYPVGSPYSYRFLARLRLNADAKAKQFSVYGRFGLRFAEEVRRKAIELLSQARDLGYEGGTRFVRNSRFLRDMARTRIGIDLPGNGDFCFRLIDYLSIGICVIGPRPRTELPVPLVGGEHVVYCQDDLADLTSLCRTYLAADDERLRIARNAREYFDRWLHKDQLACYYLNQFAQAVT